MANDTEKSEAKVTSEQGAKESANPRKWWQWLLVYPGLVIAVLGSVPTYIEAVKSYSLGVPFGHSMDAKEQNKLWQDNFDCAQKANFAPIKNKRGVEIASIVCESGDVLLRGKRPDWDNPQLRWVSWNEVAPNNISTNKTEAWIDLFPVARADENKEMQIAQGFGGQVICQRWLGNGLIMQRIGTPQGCFDQVVNTFNGWIVQQTPAPCAPC
jgi:hypothetical protein